MQNLQPRKREEKISGLPASEEHAGEREPEIPKVIAPGANGFSSAQKTLSNFIAPFLKRAGLGKSGASEILASISNGKKKASEIYVLPGSLTGRYGDLFVSAGSPSEGISTLTVSDMKRNVVAHFVENGSELSVFVPKPGALSVA